MLAKTEEKLPIENVKAEQALLGALIGSLVGSVGMLQRLDFLKPEHFYEPVHQRIYGAILDLAALGSNATPVILKNKFEKDGALQEIGGSAYLASLSGKASSIFNLKALAVEVVDSYMRRRLSQFSVWLADAACDYADSKNSQEVVANATRILSDLANETTTHEILDSRQVAIRITEGFKEKLAFYPTGLDSLDVAMGGGLYEGKAYAVAARKKVGKTIMASTISQNLNKSGIKHLFIAAEMSPTEIHQRNIAREIYRNSIAFISQDRENCEFQGKVADYAIKDPGNIYYLHIPGISFDDLKRQIAFAKHKYGIKGFILDYFQLVGGTSARQSKVEFFDGVAQWIADFCRQEKLWALVTAQINQDNNIRWGEGLRLAFDQVYHLQKSENWEDGYFMEMMDTRYTPWREVGTSDNPVIIMQKTGPYFKG